MKAFIRKWNPVIYLLLKILVNTYGKAHQLKQTWCSQESEVVYCGRLSLVADLLQGLFKEAYSLQKGLLEQLDRVSLDSSASEEEVSDIVTGECFVHIHYMYVCFSATLIIKPELYEPLYLHIFNAAFSSLSVIFLSDSQPAGYLLYYRQPGHSSACKHMEVPHQVSTAHAHVYTHVFCSCTVISSVILDWPLCY